MVLMSRVVRDAMRMVRAGSSCERSEVLSVKLAGTDVVIFCIFFFFFWEGVRLGLLLGLHLCSASDL